MTIRNLGLLASALLAAGCAMPPTGPSVMVLPGSQKSFEEFAADDAVCRAWSAERTGTTVQQAASESGASAAAIGTVVGAAAGTAIGAAAGATGVGAAAGAGGGLLLGSAAGTNQAAWAGSVVQSRYDNAYLQCMYAKGDKVPMAVESRADAGPPPPPPRASPPGRRPRHIPPPPPGEPPPPPPGED
jgi:hypothetical protein